MTHAVRAVRTVPEPCSLPCVPPTYRAIPVQDRKYRDDHASLQRSKAHLLLGNRHLSITQILDAWTESESDLDLNTVPVFLTTTTASLKTNGHSVRHSLIGLAIRSPRRAAADLLNVRAGARLRVS